MEMGRSSEFHRVLKIEETMMQMPPARSTTSDTTSAAPTRTNEIHPSVGVKMMTGKHNQQRLLQQESAEQENQRKNQNVLVMAAFPINTNRIYSLWSQLECFSSKFQQIIISGPSWSNNIIDTVIQQAKASIPSLADKHVEGRYFLNDRYDVGLWCDALLKEEHHGGFYYSSSLGDDGGVENEDRQNILREEYETETESFVLINDSIWALEHTSELLDTLREKNLTMVSLNYSGDKNQSSGNHHYWLESVYRGFNARGIQKYLNHACVPRIHPYYCNDKKLPKHRKRCIVDHFEIEISSLFNNDNNNNSSELDDNKILGLYPANAPEDLANLGWGWVTNWVYWKRLRKKQNFPVAKIHDYHLDKTKRKRPEDLKTCTKGLLQASSNNTTSSEAPLWLSELDFSVAEFDSSYIPR